jgi:ATP-dependent Lhr-like helicase
MTATRSWDIDDLFLELRRSTPFESLGREAYELVLNMLLGRYEDRHIRELKPRIRIDRTTNTIEARRGAVLSLYLSGGVIPDRGYFQLRHENDNARIGELDEEFVWEARIGQVFALGTQNWQVRKITHNDVIVAPGNAGASAPPFWRSESISRDFHYAERIGDFLEYADQNLDRPVFRDELASRFHAENEVADEIISLLNSQREHTSTMLPHRHHLIFEQISRGPGSIGGTQLVIHTGWGAMVNRPLALAFEAAVQRQKGEQPEVFVTNESIVVQLTDQTGADEFFSLVPAVELESLLRERLEGSGYFGARFRENAGRSLLLSKGRFNERKPLWMSRLQSQKLMDSVLKFEDFPILLETWRTCLQDEFDLPHLSQLLDEVSTGQIEVSEVQTGTPSPFARNAAWDQVNTYMYMTDEPKSAKTSNLRKDLLQQVVFSPGMRPGIDAAVVRQFETQRQRLLGGYAPSDETELVDWLTERSLMPADEWHRLLDMMSFEPTEACYAIIPANGMITSVNDAERHSRLLSKPSGDPQGFETLIANWMQYYGPLSVSDIKKRLQITSTEIDACLDSLVEAQTLIHDQLIRDDGKNYYCDAQNYEFLLRLTRSSQRPAIAAKPIEALTSFLYGWQTRMSGSLASEDEAGRLASVMECLRGLPLPADLFECEVLPARLPGYNTQTLDQLMQEEALQWIGTGQREVAFCFPEDAELILPSDTETSQLIEDPHARYDFNGLLDKTGLKPGDQQSATTAWRHCARVFRTNSKPKV